MIYFFPSCCSKLTEMTNNNYSVIKSLSSLEPLRKNNFKLNNGLPMSQPKGAQSYIPVLTVSEHN